MDFINELETRRNKSSETQDTFDHKGDENESFGFITPSRVLQQSIKSNRSNWQNDDQMSSSSKDSLHTNSQNESPTLLITPDQHENKQGDNQQQQNASFRINEDGSITSATDSEVTMIEIDNRSVSSELNDNETQNSSISQRQSISTPLQHNNEESNDNESSGDRESNNISEFSQQQQIKEQKYELLRRYKELKTQKDAITKQQAERAERRRRKQQPASVRLKEQLLVETKLPLRLLAMFKMEDEEKQAKENWRFIRAIRRKNSMTKNCRRYDPTPSEKDQPALLFNAQGGQLQSSNSEVNNQLNPKNAQSPQISTSPYSLPSPCPIAPLTLSLSTSASANGLHLARMINEERSGLPSLEQLLNTTCPQWDSEFYQRRVAPEMRRQDTIHSRVAQINNGMNNDGLTGEMNEGQNNSNIGSFSLNSKDEDIDRTSRDQLSDAFSDQGLGDDNDEFVVEDIKREIKLDKHGDVEDEDDNQISYSNKNINNYNKYSKDKQDKSKRIVLDDVDSDDEENKQSDFMIQRKLSGAVIEHDKIGGEQDVHNVGSNEQLQRRNSEDEIELDIDSSEEDESRSNERNKGNWDNKQERKQDSTEDSEEECKGLDDRHSEEEDSFDSIKKMSDEKNTDSDDDDNKSKSESETDSDDIEDAKEKEVQIEKIQCESSSDNSLDNSSDINTSSTSNSKLLTQQPMSDPQFGIGIQDANSDMPSDLTTSEHTDSQQN
ncbi:MAG: hypothetical protein EZS28_013913 [Streblomastix strix]|uniref:Uncharacterized protein n=1 Tax=Streblomastix strix TaxID=222440 RepID=A0A5J4W7L9_9EUKA|nr:MAG: hypothetical protein EZS28_013913 [Streblomastix strix]